MGSSGGNLDSYSQECVSRPRKPWAMVSEVRTPGSGLLSHLLPHLCPQSSCQASAPCDDGQQGQMTPTQIYLPLEVTLHHRSFWENFWPPLSKMMSTHLKLTYHSKGTRIYSLDFFILISKLATHPMICCMNSALWECSLPKNNQRWLFFRHWHSHIDLNTCRFMFY